MCENKMYINITAEDYFNELKLMQQQYGQEEDLYPWIYMLLKMTNKDDNISIRTVAGGRKSDKVFGRNQISAYGTFPDVIILNKEFLSIDTTQGIQREILKRLNEKKCLKDIKKSLTEYLNDKRRKKAIRIYFGDKNRESLLQRINEFCTSFNFDKIHGCIEAKPIVECLKEVKKEILKNEKELLKSDGRLSTEGEVIAELLWYGKVLYTNGLMWKFLEVTECKNSAKGVNNIIDLRKYLYENCIEGNREWYKELSGEDWKIKIECKTIADFGTYDDFTKIKSFDYVEGKWNKQWTKLTDFLTEINWREEPTSLITTK